jgi:hypothetical protein
LTGDLSSAQFRSLSTRAGHYESFYIKVADPLAPRGAWIRYTILKRPGRPSRGSLWCTLWTESGPPRAEKSTLEPHELSAERWVWLHGAQFVEAPESWFDATIGRIKLGGLIAPWIANAGLWLDGRMYRLGGPTAIRSASVNEQPAHCRFTLPGRDISIQGEVSAPEGSTVVWRYSDPAGSEHYVSNCSVGSLALTVRAHDQKARLLHLPAGAAYEHGAREPPPAIPVQPFPDL